MINRLQTLGQVLLPLMCFLCITEWGMAQCPTLTGTNFNIAIGVGSPYDDADNTIQADANCTDNDPLQLPIITFPGGQGWSPVGVFPPTPTISNGNMVGDIIAPFEVVTFTYMVTAEPVDAMGMPTGGAQMTEIFCINVSFVDLVRPTFTSIIPPDITVDCPADEFPPMSSDTLMAEDNCKGNFLVPPVDSPSFGPNDCIMQDTVVVRKWTATDDFGNVRIDSQLINITANEPPQFTGFTLVDSTINCENENLDDWVDYWNGVVMAPANIIDDCGMASLINNGTILKMLDLSEACDTTVYLRFIGEDNCGQMVSDSVAYTVRDTMAPILLNPPTDTLYFECDDEASIPAAVDLTAQNNCELDENISPVVVTTKTNDGSCTDYDYQITRTWTATDRCGNMAEYTQVIIVLDTIMPNFVVGFTPPADVTISCEEDISDTAQGTIELANVEDNCVPQLDLVIVGPVDTETAGACGTERSILRRWEITDACGNTLVHEQTITIEDNDAPNIGQPADVTISCDESTDPSNTGEPTVTEPSGCDPNPTFSFRDSLENGNCPGRDTIFRYWIAVDDCDNKDSVLQIITIEDIDAPVITGGSDETVACDYNTDAVQQFVDWLNNNAGATISDNCSGFTVIRQYDGTNVIADGATFADSLASVTCPTPVNNVLLSVDVDFIAIDGCGNQDTITHTFTIEDTTAPVITNCPGDDVVSTDLDECYNIYSFDVPNISEECLNILISSSPSITAPLVNPGGPDFDTPISPITFNFNVPAPPVTSTGNDTLEIILTNADIEEPTEYFDIIGEDGTVLGQTGQTAAQCLNDTTKVALTAMQFNDWGLDGVITITLQPFIDPVLPGEFAINDICGGSTAIGTLNYTVKRATDVVFEYTINGVSQGSTTTIQPFQDTLFEGSNLIEYNFTDCAGNTSSCSFTVDVEDNQAPTLVCPPSFTLNVDIEDCIATVDVPLFLNVFDNCAVSNPTIVEADGDSSLVFVDNPNVPDFTAEMKTYTFSNLTGNAAPGVVRLILYLNGDFDTSDEYYNIFGPGNTFIGNTLGSIPTANCSTEGAVELLIDGLTYNLWASSGSITFTAIPNTDFNDTNDPDAGINPCGALNGNNGDGTSYMKAVLSIDSVSPTLSITNATTVDPVVLTPPLLPVNNILNVGPNDISYQVTDLAGNTGSCDFTITIVDNELPTVLCVDPLFVDINPSGFIEDIILPEEIDAGSSDNCGIASMEVSPNLITCDLIGSIIDVTLTVTDVNNNVNTCNTLIAVEAEEPQPSVVSNCGSDTLFLFSNPPVTPGGNSAYQCEWTGPNGFVSFECDPVILDADLSNVGFYQVTIRGITGCEAEGTVQVTEDDLPLFLPTLQASASDGCIGEVIDLTTEAVPGGTVMYNWYSGTAPNGTLLATTELNTYSWTADQTGTNSFYLIVERGGCSTDASQEVSVSINETPSATIVPVDDQPCEGGEIVLGFIGTNLQNTTCHWTGPAGFESFNCNPAPIVDITDLNEGFYNLEVTVDGCSSFADPVFIDVRPRPAQPEAISNTFENAQLCEGETLLMTATIVSGVISYEWTGPDFTVYNSPSNVLAIPFANLLQHGGNWKVRAFGNGCVSEFSEDHFVYISTAPETVNASIAPNPACEGETIQLEVSSGSMNVSYEWLLPNGQFIAGNQIELTDLSSGDEGQYQAVVTNEFGCSTTETIDLTVNSRPNITGIANNAPNCTLGPVNIELTATIFPPDDGTYIYSWTGDGFGSADSVAVIPSANDDDSGPYSLVVTNGDGCSSEVATTTVIVPEVVPTPAAPLVDVTGPYCEGQTVVFTTTPGSGNNVEYVWTTPTGTETTQNSSYTIDSLTVTDEGSFTVMVVSDGCQSSLSGSTVIEVKEKPVAVPQSNSPVCEGDALELTVDCMVGNIYEWQGPNGFSSALCNPVIPEATANLMDEPFRVRVNTNGCWSDEAQISVNVKEKPEQPNAVNFGPYCASTEDVVVGISPPSATPGSTYTWFETGSDIPLGQSTGLTFVVPGADQYGDGSISFTVVSDLNGCASVESESTEVEINVVPNNVAIAGPDVQVCDGEIIELQGEAPTIGTGLWTLVNGNPNGVSIANPDQSFTAVAGLTPGVDYSFQWTLSNGVCEDYSSDQADIFVNIVEFADAGGSIDLCNETSAQLNAAMPTSNIGMWSQPEVQELLGVVIVDPSDPNTVIEGLVPGQSYIFTWTIDGGCGEDSETIQVVVSNETAFAGSDFDACSSDGCVQLSAIGASGGGVWTTNDPNADIISPNDPETMVCNLTPGEYAFTWTINDGACGSNSIDVVTVAYNDAPIANDDFANVNFGSTIELDLLANDHLPGLFTITIPQNQTVGGTFELNAQGLMTYSASVSFIGEEVLSYEICVQDCECSTGIVTLQVGANADCSIPNIFTPNNDGFNDSFVIPCLANEDVAKGTTMSIFNRWGDEVFNAAPYQNNWEGTFDGEDLPAGVYYYILELGDGSEPRSGYVHLQR